MGDHILVAADYYSQYEEVAISKMITVKKLIESLTPIFSQWGMPYSMCTDNSPQFMSEEFQEYLSANEIEHQLIPPYWPQANGEVEHQNCSLLKILQVATVNGESWEYELQTFLLSYRATSVTGKSPFELMCGRPMKTKLPSRPVESLDKDMQDGNWSRKLSDETFAGLPKR